MLSTEHLQLKIDQQTPKLMPKQIGPFSITQVISPVAYRLQLPPTLSAKHSSFHVSKLSPYVDGSISFPLRSSSASLSRPLPELSADGEQEWAVEEIIAKRTNRRQVQYLVKWEGYPTSENTWEPVANLKNCIELIQEYENKTVTAN